MLAIDEKILLEKHFPAWDNLNNSQKNIIINKTSIITLQKGESLQSLKDACSGVLIMKSGMMRAYTISESGKDVTYYRLKKGDVDVLSASCVLKGLTFDIYWEAMEMCEILQILPCAFSEVMFNNPCLEAACYKISTSRLSQIIVAMQYMMFSSVQERLSCFLLTEMKTCNSKIILMTHEQIAKLMGTAREVVTRMLKEFSHDGYVRLERGKVIILDVDGLEKLI